MNEKFGARTNNNDTLEEGNAEAAIFFLPLPTVPYVPMNASYNVESLEIA